MVERTPDGYAIHRSTDYENVIFTINELLNMMGQLNSEYDRKNMYLITWLIADMMPPPEALK